MKFTKAEQKIIDSCQNKGYFVTSDGRTKNVLYRLVQKEIVRISCVGECENNSIIEAKLK